MKLLFIYENGFTEVIWHVTNVVYLHKLVNTIKFANNLHYCSSRPATSFLFSMANLTSDIISSCPSIFLRIVGFFFRRTSVILHNCLFFKYVFLFSVIIVLPIEIRCSFLPYDVHSFHLSTHFFFYFPVFVSNTFV